MMAYELWETESGNLLASFSTEAAALAAVADRVGKHGPSSVATITLFAVDDSDTDGNFESLAEGPELVKLIASMPEAGSSLRVMPADGDASAPSLADVDGELDDVQSRLSSALRAARPDLFTASGQPRKGALAEAVQGRTGKKKLSRADIQGLLRKKSS